MSDKKQYDIKLDILVPTTITYRVSALNEQEALKEIDKSSARKLSIQQHLNRRIRLKATVYAQGTSMVKFSKTYRNI